MAEIKDIYSLEFNASQFQNEVDSAINKIEELSDAIIDGQDATNDLADAQEGLTRTLGMEVKGVENLNSKRNVLVETQKRTNKETKTGQIVSTELDKTNKQLAVSTGQVVKQQKNMGAAALDGARKLNSLRRIGMQLGSVFRLLGGFNPFGLIATVLPTVIAYGAEYLGLTKKTNEEAEKQDAIQKELIGTYLNETQELNNLFGALNEANKGRGDKAAIIAELQKRYPEYLKNIDLEKASNEELAKAYDLVGMSILRNIVQKQAQKEQEEVLTRLIQKQTELSQQQKFLNAQNEEANRLAQRYQDSNPQAVFAKQGVAVGKLKDEINSLTTELTMVNMKYAGLAEELYASIKTAIDPMTLTGTFVESSKDMEKQAEKTNKEIDKFNKELLEQEKKDIYERWLAMKEATEEMIKFNEQLLTEESELRKNIELQTVEEINNERFESFKDTQDKILSYLETTSQTELNLALAGNEELRNASIQSAINTIKDEKLLKTEIERIDAEFNKRKLNIERENELKIAKERLKIAKEVMQQQFILGIDTADTQSQIAQLELAIAQLEKPIIDFAEKTEDKFKDIRDRTFELIQAGSDAIFSVLSAQAQAYISQLDRAADKSKSTLDEIRGNSEDFNARQLEIEKKRLEQVEAERQRAVEKEKAIALIQLTVNSTLAIAKAAAEGGIAAPFTIASTIIALLAGFAQARIAAGNAFYHGSEFIDPDMKYGPGRDAVPAMLNRGERIFTTDKNREYWDVLSAVHNNKIPADLLNNFANGYQSGGLMKALQNVGGNYINLSNELGGKSFFVNVNSDNSMLENRLERIENVLSDLPKYMPKTTVTANANGIFKIVEQRQKRAKFISDRTK